ncbi:MAG TPA: hypothetical protein GXZ26_03820 [Firmicutes bacterium]|nr:hypothetical protein [Bacillota bacterium]
MKALVLFSGGLDSLLAVKLIQEAGVEVEAVHFLQPFLPPEVEAKQTERLRRLMAQTGAPLRIVRLDEDYLRMLEAPKHGYGRAFNPCLDCHIYFLRRAGEMLEATGASFIVTGEVVGQRPKSQYKGAFPLIDREAGLEGLIVRPLSARLLPPTIPEEKGWISLDHCPSIQGRQRKIQMELAKKYGLHEYESPAGGCLLTNKEYGRKVEDLLRHNGRLDLDAMRLLSVGRHFRLSPEFKAVIGRNQKENRRLFFHFFRRRRDPQLLLVKTMSAPGPLALGCGRPSTADLENLAQLTARYSDLPPGKKTAARILGGGPEHRRLELPVTGTKDPSLPDRFRIN